MHSVTRKMICVSAYQCMRRCSDVCNHSKLLPYIVTFVNLCDSGKYDENLSNISRDNATSYVTHVSL